MKRKTVEQRINPFFLGALTFWGLVLRVYNLGQQSLWIDESFTINGALGILNHWYPLMDSGFVYKTQLLASYLTALSISIFGQTEWAARLPFAVFGTACIPLVYLVGRKMWNTRAGLIAAVFTTFMPLHITWSRNSRGYTLLFFFMSLSLYFLLRYLKKPSTRDFVFLIGACVCSVLSHYFGFSLIPLYMLIIVLKLPRKTILKPLLGLLGLLVLLIFILGINVERFITWTSMGLFYMPQYWTFLTNDLFFLFSLAAVGLIVLALKQWKLAVGFLIFSVSYLYFLSFHVWLLHYRYLFLLAPLFVLLAGVALDGMGGYLSKTSTWLGYLFILLVLFSFSWNSFLPRSMHSLEWQTPQPDFKGAYNEIELGKDDFVISAYPTISLFYIGRSHYWLGFTMSGRSIDMTKDDYYTGEPIINSPQQLEEILTDNHGWIITDNLAMRMLSKEEVKVIRDMSELTFRDVRDAFSGVYVYRFQGENSTIPQ